MTKSISCKDAGKDCSWSASSTTNNVEELMSMVTEHVLAEHKEIELNVNGYRTRLSRTQGN